MIYHNTFTYQASVDIDFVAVVDIVEVDTGAAVGMDVAVLSGKTVQVLAGIPVVIFVDKAVVGRAVDVFVDRAVVALTGTAVEVAGKAVAVAGTVAGMVVFVHTGQVQVVVDPGEMADHSAEQHIIRTINKPFKLRRHAT